MPPKRPKGAELITVQFRVGVKVVRYVDKCARLHGISRSKWIAQAAEAVVRGAKTRPCPLSAEALLGRRKTVMVRMSKFVLEIIDEMCAELGVTRTIWLVDAILTRIVRERKSAQYRVSTAARKAAALNEEG